MPTQCFGETPIVDSRVCCALTQLFVNNFDIINLLFFKITIKNIQTRYVTILILKITNYLYFFSFKLIEQKQNDKYQF